VGAIAEVTGIKAGAREIWAERLESH